MFDLTIATDLFPILLPELLFSVELRNNKNVKIQKITKMEKLEVCLSLGPSSQQIPNNWRSRCNTVIKNGPNRVQKL
jgi:hypothetical protein